MDVIGVYGAAKKPPEVEAGHWYDRTGNPCYQQTTAKGAPRGTDLRDGRKLGLVPSVTTVLSVLAKPGLVNWMIDQGIMAALTLPRIDGESEADFLRRVKEDSKAQGRAAAEEGTRIHDACECAMNGFPFPDTYLPHVNGAQDKLTELFPDVDDWIAEQSFAHELGFGGKVDVFSPSTGIVVDYKSTDACTGSQKKLHWEQHYQLAAYQDGLQLPRNACANIFISRKEPGCVFAHVWKAEEVALGWEVFTASLELWKRLKKFDSSFSRADLAA